MGDDSATYATAKDLLYDMLQTGNFASKGHAEMLNDVEVLRVTIPNMQSHGLDMLLDQQWEVDDWMAQLQQSQAMPTVAP